MSFNPGQFGGGGGGSDDTDSDSESETDDTAEFVEGPGGVRVEVGDDQQAADGQDTQTDSEPVEPDTSESDTSRTVEGPGGTERTFDPTSPLDENVSEPEPPEPDPPDEPDPPSVPDFEESESDTSTSEPDPPRTVEGPGGVDRDFDSGAPVDSGSDTSEPEPSPPEPDTSTGDTTTEEQTRTETPEGVPPDPESGPSPDPESDGPGAPDFGDRSDDFRAEGDAETRTADETDPISREDRAGATTEAERAALEREEAIFEFANQVDQQVPARITTDDFVVEDGQARLSEAAIDRIAKQSRPEIEGFGQVGSAGISGGRLEDGAIVPELTEDAERVITRERAFSRLNEQTRRDLDRSQVAFQGGEIVPTVPLIPDRARQQAQDQLDTAAVGLDRLDNQPQLPNRVRTQLRQGLRDDPLNQFDEPTEETDSSDGEATIAGDPDSELVVDPDEFEEGDSSQIETAEETVERRESAPDRLEDEEADQRVFEQVRGDIEDETGLENVEREDVNLARDGQSVQISLTEQGRQKVEDQREANEEFGDAPLGDDFLRDAGDFISKNIIDPVAETSGDAVGSVVGFAAGDEAGEKAEATTEGVASGLGVLINIPNTTAGLIEAGEFIGYGAAQTVQGRGAEYADKATDAGAQAVQGFADYAQENPFRTAGQVAGSLLISSAAIGGASRLSSTAGRATAYAVQPGEELAGLAGNQALTRTGSGLTRLGNTALSTGRFDVSGEAVRSAGTRTQQSADTLFPNNEPLIFSEEAAIRTARSVRNRVSSRVGSTRDTVSGDTELSPTPRQQDLIDLARPGTQTEAGTETTDAPGATSEVGSDTEDVLDATTGEVDPVEARRQPEEPPAYRPDFSRFTTETETTAADVAPREGNIIRQRSASGSDLGTRRLPETRQNVRELLADESATLEFRNQRQTETEPTEPEFEPTQDEILGGSPRDRISTDVTRRNLEQRRQNQGGFEGSRDPVGEAESRREQAQRQEVTQETEVERGVTRSELFTGTDPALGQNIAPFQRPFEDTIPGTEPAVGTRPAEAVDTGLDVGVRADTGLDVGQESLLDFGQEFDQESETETEIEQETETELETEFETEFEQEQETEVELQTEQEIESELFGLDDKDPDDGREGFGFAGSSEAFGTDFVDPLTGDILRTDLDPDSRSDNGGEFL